MLQSRTWKYVYVILIIGLIISTSGLTFIYFNLQSNYIRLQSEFEEVSWKVENQREFLDRLKSASNITDPAYGLTAQQLYDIIEPSVVMITNKVAGSYGLVPYSQGSGFIYNKEGFIITNHHVVRGAQSIEVTFLDGTIKGAQLIGADPYSDLAVIKVDSSSKDLQPLLVGNSSSLKVGDRVLAIGNPFGLSGSMTHGIVSQLDRTMSSDYGYLIVGVIQTDAAINPGNSGGPLLNVWGEVIGVNSAIASKSGEFSGVGFAIPSNLMLRVVTSLINEGSYTHPWFGLAGVDVTPEIADAMNLNFSKGFLVTYIAPGSPVDKAGVKAGEKTIIVDGKKINIGGDVIIGVDNVTVRKLEDLLVYIEFNKKPHDTVILKLVRNNQVIRVMVEMEERPPPG